MASSASSVASKSTPSGTACSPPRTSIASRSKAERRGRPASAGLLALRLEIGEDAVGFEPPIGAAGERRRAFRTEQALIGEVGDPGLALGGSFRRPRCEPDLAHGLGDLADLFAAAAAVFDDALEEIGALFLPIDAGIGLLERGQHRVLDAVGACRG